ncbi:uncharacterized protein LOC100900995 isoform X2 [Galendromus occidentalis]|nr:uncharacterized protein LOC100900995 isoform X2 [Galendromus occidentalis]
MKIYISFMSLVVAAVAADSTSDYMNSVLKLAGNYLVSLGLEPARIPTNFTFTAWNLQTDINSIHINGLGNLTPKKCKLQKPKVECDVSLKSVSFVAFGRFKDAQTFEELNVTLPVREGELEIEINTGTKASKVKFDDKLKFDKLKFSRTTVNSKALDDTAKALDSKLTPIITEFLSKDFFDVVKNAVTHTEVPSNF